MSQQLPDGVMSSDSPGVARAMATVTEIVDQDFSAFLDALDELIEFTAEDAISSGSFCPSRQGPIEPDSYTADQLHAAVVAAARKAFGVKQEVIEPVRQRSTVDFARQHNSDRPYRAFAIVETGVGHV